jgi:hypothetical protein
MSKELELLKLLKPKEEDCFCDCVPDEKDEAYELLKKALTPPTADEVCEALRKYATNYNNVVYEENSFILKSDKPYSDCVVATKMEFPETKIDKKKIIIPYYLPAYLVEMIGKFYKGEKDEYLQDLL